jgi:hypothetical protein
MLTAVIAEGMALALLAVLVLGLLRSHALILRALHELGAGLELEREAAASAGRAGPVPVDLERGVVATGGRPPGSPAPEIVGTTLDGEPRTLPGSQPAERTLLAFLTSGCSGCATFWEEFTGGVEVPGEGRLAVIAKDSAEESPATLRRLARGRLDVIQSSAAWADYDVPGSPYFVYVEGGVVTGEGSATSWPQVRELMLA